MDKAKKIKNIIERRIREIDKNKNSLRIDRKLDFLLDIRGYFIVNKIKGDYVEFGCYSGEMLFAALKVLVSKGLCGKFIGLDTFEGEPGFIKGDSNHNLYNEKGDYCSTFKWVRRFFPSR